MQWCNGFALQIPGAPKVLGMVLNRQGSLLLLNCHDRMVRMFELARRGKDLAGVELSQLSDALGTQQVLAVLFALLILAVALCLA